jgi:hypothetical protein
MNRPDVGERRYATQHRAARRGRRDGSLARAQATMACGETGDGRMLEPEEIFEAITRSCTPKLLQGPYAAPHRRAHVRSDRSCARHHQYELGQDGLRAGAGSRRGGCGGDAHQRGRRRCRLPAACSGST